MATAKHRAIDRLRRSRRLERKQEELARDVGMQLAMGHSDFDAVVEGGVGDDLLGLVFMCCHPVLATEARGALTLRLLGGLSAKEIAWAFLAPEATVAQRIVRAKKTLGAARVPFEVPDGDELPARLPSVLEVIYLVFNEGYAATAGDDWMRPALCEDALRLGRVVAGLMPKEPEVHGLVALMEIQASRSRARVGPGGEPVLLLDQANPAYTSSTTDRDGAARSLDGNGDGVAVPDQGAYEHAAVAPVPIAEPIAKPPTTTCRVPRLKGLTLAKATTRLKAAGCRRGTVKKPKVKKGAKKPRKPPTFVVVKQGVRAGKVLPFGARVGLTVQVKKPKKKPAKRR